MAARNKWRAQFGPFLEVSGALESYLPLTFAGRTAPDASVYQLPPYALEFNPVEGVWLHLKRLLANLTKHSLDQLTALVKTRLKRMQ